MKLTGILLAAASALAVGGAIVTLASQGKSAAAQELRSIDRATSWINSKPLTAEQLKGKVVLVSFWTYSCINWLRTQPYLRGWADRYGADGLVVIGVHTPEFGFEKELQNVQWAAAEYDVRYPVVTDNDLEIWRAFGNRYWPAFYFIDAKGAVRHTKFGEGDYEQSEEVLRQLLTGVGAELHESRAQIEVAPVELSADWASVASGETYLGLLRSAGFASPREAVLDQEVVYTAPEHLRLNQWALAGPWTVSREAALAKAPGASVTYRFHARDLNLVMGPTSDRGAVRFRVLIDGKPPGPSHGVDTDAEGNGKLTEQRYYQLIRQRGPVAERDFTIEFLDAGAELFSFTFG